MEINEIIQLVQGFSISYYIYTIYELGILNYLYNEGMSIEKLSRELKLEEQLTIRIIRPLQALNIISRVNENYKLTLLGKKLNNVSVRNRVIMCGREGMKCWEKFFYALKVGCKPYELHSVLHPFEEHAFDNLKFELFNDSMINSSQKVVIKDFLASCKIKENSRFVDVGGGIGVIIFKFLEEIKGSTGIIIDLSHVKNKAQKNIELNGMQERCIFEEGDFFRPFFVQGDYYILSRVLHDWDDLRAYNIIKNLEGTMQEGNHLLVVEKVIPDKVSVENLNLYIDDLNVWTMCGGKERTLEEFCNVVCQRNLVYNGKYKVGQEKYLLDFEYCTNSFLRKK